MKKLPIIIDTDIGSDDCLAILTLAAERNEDISFLLSTFGNSTIRATTENLNTAKSLFGLRPKVVVGAEKPQDSSPFSPDHDLSFYEYNSIFPKGNSPVEYPQNFIDCLHAHISKQEKVDYIALGPLTNLALLIKKYPDVINHIENTIIMGGGIDIGNVNAYAEYNIYCDAQSAAEVFKSGLKIHMVPINVCYRSKLTEEEAALLSKGESLLRKCVALLLRIENEVSEKFGNPLGIIYDAVASIYYLHPDLFITEKTGIDVIQEGEKYGMTSLTDKRNNVFYVKELDKKGFFNVFAQAVEKMDGEYAKKKEEQLK